MDLGGSIGTWGGPYEFGVLCGGVGGIAMDWGGGASLDAWVPPSYFQPFSQPWGDPVRPWGTP